MKVERLAQAASKVCVERGNFELANAGQSDWRIDASKLAAVPATAEAVVREMLRSLNRMKIRTVIPVPHGGNAFAAQIAVCSYCQPESPIVCYGLRGAANETDKPPQRPAAVIEDVLTTGLSAMKTAQAAIARGADVQTIIAVIKRLDHPVDPSVNLPWSAILTAYDDPEKGIVIQPATQTIREK